MRLKKAIVSSLFISISVTQPTFIQNAFSESLPDLVDSAIKNNPELKSSEARWKMYTGRIKQASSWEDPMVMLKLQNMPLRSPLSFNRDTTTAKVIGLTQQIPFPGKLGLKEELARYDAESYRWQIEERKLELTRMVKETYYQIYAMDKALDTVAKNLNIVEDLLKIAESRYTVGQGAQADILRGGVEKSKLLEMQISLQQQRQSLSANLDFLLARQSGSAEIRVDEFRLPDLTSSREELREQAYRDRPQIKSLMSLSNKGTTGHKLATRESYPDFSLSFEYMQREPAMSDPGYDMYSLSLSFNLPIQKERREAMKVEYMSESRMVEEELNALKSNINYVIADNLAIMERRKKLVELYRTGLIPQAEQSLESALIGYRVGKVDFLTLLDGRTTLFNYERELSDSKAEYMIALARLEAAIATNLTSQQLMEPSSLPASTSLQQTPEYKSPSAHQEQTHKNIN